MYHKKGLWAIKKKNGGVFPKHNKKLTATSPSVKPPKFYPADHVAKPLNTNKNLRNSDQEKNVLPQEKKDEQKTVDAALLKAIEGVPELKAYLSARFSLKSGMKPHDLVF